MTEPHVIDGVEVSVVEFTGEAGDVYLMHPWALHTVSSNCRDQPRLMLMMALFRADAEMFAAPESTPATRRPAGIPWRD